MGGKYWLCRPQLGHLAGSGGGGTLLKGVDHSSTATAKLLLQPDTSWLDAEDLSAAASKPFSGAGFKSKNSWWPFTIFSLFFIEP